MIDGDGYVHIVGRAKDLIITGRPERLPQGDRGSDRLAARRGRERLYRRAPPRLRRGGGSRGGPRSARRREDDVAGVIAGLAGQPGPVQAAEAGLRGRRAAAQRHGQAARCCARALPRSVPPPRKDHGDRRGLHRHRRLHRRNLPVAAALSRAAVVVSATESRVRAIPRSPCAGGGQGEGARRAGWRAHGEGSVVVRTRVPWPIGAGRRAARRCTPTALPFAPNGISGQSLRGVASCRWIRQPAGGPRPLAASCNFLQALKDTAIGRHARRGQHQAGSTAMPDSARSLKPPMLNTAV